MTTALQSPDRLHCIFCAKLQAHQTLAETQQYFILKDLYPADQHHILICPKIHVASYLDCDSNVLAGALQLGRQWFKKLGLQSGRFLFNVGTPYAQIPHAHLHMLGFSTHTNE